jgi:hypothetical protein
MAFEAKYPGQCQNCGSWFKAGVLIVSLPMATEGYAHQVCPDPLAAGHPPCPDCFLVHPPGTCDR